MIHIFPPWFFHSCKKRFLTFFILNQKNVKNGFLNLFFDVFCNYGFLQCNNLQQLSRIELYNITINELELELYNVMLTTL